jgi:hypothetical protein
VKSLNIIIFHNHIPTQPNPTLSLIIIIRNPKKHILIFASSSHLLLEIREWANIILISQVFTMCSIAISIHRRQSDCDSSFVSLTFPPSSNVNKCGWYHEMTFPFKSTPCIDFHLLNWRKHEMFERVRKMRKHVQVEMSKDERYSEGWAERI